MKRKPSRKLVGIAVLLAVGLAFIMPAQATKTMTGKDFVAECKPTITSVTVTEARTMYDSGDFVFLDVRTEKEYKKGAIPNALHVQRGVLEFKIGKKLPDKAARIVVYCKAGSRATLCTCALKKMGYVNVVCMDGGWKAWIKEGHPVG